MRRRSLIAGTIAAAGCYGISQSGVSRATPPVTVPSLLDVALALHGDLGDIWWGGRDKPGLADFGRLDVSRETFTDDLAASFHNSYGGRLLLLLFRHDTRRNSILQAWEDAQFWYERVRTQAVSFDDDYLREQQLAERAAPEGVTNAIRVDGRDVWWGDDVGIGVYAIGPDLIAVICVTGLVSPLPGWSSAAAVDRAAELIAKRYREMEPSE